jgi:hypothetical protein
MAEIGESHVRCGDAELEASLVVWGAMLVQLKAEHSRKSGFWDLIS